MSSRRLRAVFACCSLVAASSLVGTALAQREAPPTQPPWVMLPAVTPSSSAAAPPATTSPAAPDNGANAPPATPSALPPPSSAPPASVPPAYGVPAYPPPAYPPPGYSPYGYPRYVYEPPPPVMTPMYMRPGYHVHDGFYFRFGVGLGVMSAKATLPYSLAGQTGSVTNTFNGAAFTVDAAIGGAIARGFILAFDIGGHSADTLSQSGTPPPTGAVAAVSYSRLGILADWYINPRRGFHVQGGLGFGFGQLGYGDGTADSLSGTQANAGVGYEGWVGSDLAIGALLRLDWSKMKNSLDIGDQTLTITTPSLLFTMTFN